MNEILWTFPGPVTGMIRGDFLKMLPKRCCELSFSVEGEHGEEKWLTLSFSGVETFKVTYLTSLGAIDRALRTEAYGKLIAIEGSGWLAEIEKAYQQSIASMRRSAQELKHLMILFDDGPCYEFICSAFELRASLSPIV